MPGLEVVNTSLASPTHLDPPQFRAHKSLRRRPNVVWCPPVIDTKPRARHGRPSNGTPSTAAPVRPPLTPPGVAPSEDDLSSTGTSTPKPSHPPTPETTPPRVVAPAPRPGLPHLGQSSTSSRAESFQTAYEMISDAETETPRRSSPVLPTRQNSVRTETPFEYGDRSGESTPVPEPRKHRLPTTLMEPPVHRQVDVDADRKVSPPRRKKSTRDGAPRIMRTEPPEPRYHRDEVETQSVRSSLREPIRDPLQPVGGLSIEQFREEIGWPRPEDRPLPTQPEDTRRLSDISTSTVEVMIIDSPQSAQRSLRHTDKRGSLRSGTSPVPNSLASSESQHRLVHKAGRITESDRKSIASEISFSGTSSVNLPPQNVDVVPVVVIPERSSSLKSSASTSRDTSQSRSRHSSRRGPSASGSRPGSREPAHRRRPSDTNASIGRGAEPRGRHSGRPTIPPRGSSLSAPTSRNHSRTASLTSESLRDHALAMEPGMPERAAAPPVPRPDTIAREDTHDAAEASKTQSIIIGVEDMSHLRPPSMPYTQISIPSSSPGLIEVSEARTVVFFPHNNESLLLVDPQAQPALHGPAPGVEYPELRPLRTDDSPHHRYEMTSPLKNPRQPPKPPVCHVVPPTPVQENDPPQGTAAPHEPSKRPGRRFGPGRRPWMGRPRSDSFHSFVRSLSLTSVKNRKAGKDVDGRLQSFWRPRRFWEDSEAEDSPQASPRSPAHPEADTVIKNSLGMPQQRIVFEGPALRSPDTRRRFDHARPQPNRNTLVGSQVFSPEAFCSQTSLHHHRFRSLSWWRLRFRPGKVRNIRKRVRRTWQRHVEHRRQVKREKLKQSIGGAVLMESSTQLKITD
ncbi:uncharacterized protein BO80DRAFT_92022 [Aspergillus ibericus CBS 121593]|uniref:Uncharacterized protein n=1 Tax=Aspergillus ibericus CBS 121593 TaxID=1448316 RepID=A0A395GZQ6_9EURO|nr:hypothetical protein BO80DRAFT_92022 [Aspergillus ibericus CBS 121593]RAL00569.1 hypothetical protein BO80DRAFT_92022 [Aspergillus ibericus CBS 121593]